MTDVVWAMLVRACILLFIAFFALRKTSTVSAEIGFLVAFFTNLLGCKYQMYAETYRGRRGGVGCCVLRIRRLGAEAASAMLERSKRTKQINETKIWPVYIQKQQLAISRLPKQKAA